MSGKSPPAILLRSIKLPEDVRASFWASRFRQAKSDGLIIFVVFTFLGFGIAGIAEAYFFSDLSSALSVVIGLACGLLATLGVTVLHFVDLPLIRRDLKAGTLVEAHVVCKRAARVRLKGSSLMAVALDCGDDVLVLIGEWWLNKNRLDIWEDPRSRKQFPALRFRIHYLPRSGQVLRVYVDEGPLRIDESDPVEPMISLDCSKHAEVVHVKQDFQSLVVEERAI